MIRRHARFLLGGGLLVAALLAIVVVAFGGSPDVVVYNGRSQYGDEAAFKAFEDASGKTLELRGGTAPELFERLRSEGSETPADLLVTTDLANLWRAKEAGLLASVDTPALERQVPADFRDPDGDWWGMSLRIRTPMRHTSVDPKLLQSYEELGSPRWKGKLCLRTSNNEYNQSLVADMLAKRGPEKTRALLESWIANDPRILGSDVDVLEAIAAGRCQVGLTNHYYLARELEEDPDFAVAPAWPDQDAAGAHTNLSGVGLVEGTEHRADAIALMEHLTAPAAQREIAANGELPANPDVPPAEHVRDWAGVKLDPIDVEQAGRLLPDAVALMQEVGWR
ncbi:MAG TPA: extracellular solute-binding protein [Solirubrobacteraceae bacterium]|nr:extracellular solute-binding protein [Solirubrobacteraceae bacterium]